MRRGVAAAAGLLPVVDGGPTVPVLTVKETGPRPPLALVDVKLVFGPLARMGVGPQETGVWFPSSAIVGCGALVGESLLHSRMAPGELAASPAPVTVTVVVPCAWSPVFGVTVIGAAALAASAEVDGARACDGDDGCDCQGPPAENSFVSLHSVLPVVVRHGPAASMASGPTLGDWEHSGR